MSHQKSFPTKATLTNPNRVELYMPAESKETVEKAKKILSAEGSSLSKFVLAEIQRYVRLHEPGNPQQRLDVIARDGKAYHAPLVCENDHCRAEVNKLFKCLCVSGRVMSFCEKCKIDKTGRTIKRVLGVFHR